MHAWMRQNSTELNEAQDGVDTGSVHVAINPVPPDDNHIIVGPELVE